MIKAGRFGETLRDAQFGGILGVLQPHSTAGIRLAELTVGMENGTYSLEEVSALTKRTCEDSFLYQLDEEIYRRLGIAWK